MLINLIRGQKPNTLRIHQACATENKRSQRLRDHVEPWQLKWMNAKGDGVKMANGTGVRRSPTCHSSNVTPHSFSFKTARSHLCHCHVLRMFGLTLASIVLSSTRLFPIDLTLRLGRFGPPGDSAQIPGSFGFVLSGEPHLQQLLGPLEEVCTAFFHRETNRLQQQKL